MPQGFFPPRPRHDESPKKYWITKPCQLSPYHFVNYEDIFKQTLHLSMFEVDGTYSGQSQEWGTHNAINRYDYFLLKDRNKRVVFNISYLNNIESIKVIEGKDHHSFE